MASPAPVIGWLVYRGRDQHMRITKKLPSLDFDEIAWRIRLAVPEPWRRVSGDIVITLPEGGPAEVGVTERVGPA